jgi:hypothetical protein
MTELAMPQKAAKLEKRRFMDPLVDGARTIAAGEGEHLPGAKPDDCMTCQHDRMDALRP